MALVKFGAGVSEIRGKEGGVIYSRNAYGAYIKTKVSPVNPQTAFQQAQRALMGNLSSSWAQLSSAQKQGWDNLGAQVTRTNRFGDQTNYTGFALYMRLNRNLSIIGYAAKATAPTPPTLPTLAVYTLTATVSGTVLTLSFDPTTPGATMNVVVYATNNIYLGRRFVKNYYRKVFSAINPTTSPLDLYALWEAHYNNPLVAGTHIFVKAKIIDSDTGFDTTPVVTSALVAAS